MCIPFDELTNDQQAIVIAVFSDPPRSDIPWTGVLDLFHAIGCVPEVQGNRVSIAASCQDQRIGTFTYSGKQGCVSRQMIRYLRDYLCEVGVQPN